MATLLPVGPFGLQREGGVVSLVSINAGSSKFPIIKIDSCALPEAGYVDDAGGPASTRVEV
jgi:hypothetical protein